MARLSLQLLLCIVLKQASSSAGGSSLYHGFGRTTRTPLTSTTTTTTTTTTFNRIPWVAAMARRGGASEIAIEEDDDDVEEEEEDYEEEDEEVEEEKDVADDLEEEKDDIEEEDEEVVKEESPTTIAAASSHEPISITFHTNLGNRIIDTSLELLVSKSRTIGSVKQTLSRMLPGRPPSLRIVSQGQCLSDTVLIADLMEDQDDDDDDDDTNKSLSLTLDMIPPVDPKFATHLPHMLADMTTSDLLDAYAYNTVAMIHNGLVLSSSSSSLQQDDDDKNNELHISLLQREAQQVRNQWLQDNPSAASLLLQPTESTHTTHQRRGQRIRTAKGGGAKTNLRRILQTNLNLNWPDTIRNVLLFVFFGLFGGRNTVSRALLLWGAPLCVLVQARPIKRLWKLALYGCAHPPGIFLSLLPAPQQAILSFDTQDAMQTLYGTTQEGMGTDCQNEEDDEEEDDDEDD